MASANDVVKVEIIRSDTAESTGSNSKRRKSDKLRRSYTFDEKLRVLQQLDTEPMASVCDALAINERTLRKWRRQRAEIERQCSSDRTKHLKKSRSSLVSVPDPVMYCKIEMVDLSNFADSSSADLLDNDRDPLALELPEKSRRSYSFQEKLQVLRRLDTERAGVVCAELQINQRTLRKWKKQRDEIERICASESTKYLKKHRTPHNPELDNTLEAWVTEARDQGIVISGSDVQSKARSLNVEMGGKSNFKASSGWLTRWKQRKGYRSLRELTGPPPSSS